jgi:TonB family protein
MTMKYLSMMVFVSAVACAVAFSRAAPPSEQQVWPCGTTSNLLVDSGGQPVWIGSDELRKHAINAPSPKLPSSLRAAGKITVNVLVDSDGHVKCARVLNGHPTLRRAVTEAVQNWTFKPFLAGDKPVAVSGHLSFVFK